MKRVGKCIVVVLVSIFTLSMFSGPAYSTSLTTKVLRGAAVGYAVTKAAGPLDDFINKATLQHGMQSGLDTKVVPILSVGDKGYVGGAQVSGPRADVRRVQAVFQYETSFDRNQYRIKVLVPSASLNPLKLERVEKVGISAIIDVAIDGRQRFQTVGKGVQTGDVLRGAVVAVAVKNASGGINDVINKVSFNPGLATKVVPMASFGEKAYIGGAQVSASALSINEVNAVWQYEDLFDRGRFRVKILVPTTSSNPLRMKRVQGAGITAVIDMALARQQDARSTQTRSRDDLRGTVVGTAGRSGKVPPGWIIGQREGRKHLWVDAKWQVRLNGIQARDREPFVIWLDGRKPKDRDIKDFDKLYREFSRQKR